MHNVATLVTMVLRQEQHSRLGVSSTMPVITNQTLLLEKLPAIKTSGLLKIKFLLSEAFNPSSSSTQVILISSSIPTPNMGTFHYVHPGSPHPRDYLCCIISCVYQVLPFSSGTLQTQEPSCANWKPKEQICKTNTKLDYWLNLNEIKCS